MQRPLTRSTPPHPPSAHPRPERGAPKKTRDLSNARPDEVEASLLSAADEALLEILADHGLLSSPPCACRFPQDDGFHVIELRGPHTDGPPDAAVFDRILERIVDEPAVGAHTAALYGDPRALPALSGVLDSDYLDVGGRDGLAPRDRLSPTDVVAIADAIVWLGGTLTELQAAKVTAAWATLDAAVDGCPCARKPHRAAPRPGRNAPCHCGSGRKYKKCHLAADERAP